MTFPTTVQMYDAPSTGYQYAAGSFVRLSGNPAEGWAGAQWIFGNDATSLNDLTEGLALTPNATGPSYTSSGVVIPDSGYNGLKTPYADKLTYTAAGVFKRALAGTGNQILMGSMSNTTNAGGSGIFAFPAGPSYYSFAAGLNADGGVAFTMPGTDGQYVFVAIVETPGQRLIYTGSGGTLTLAGTVNGTRFVHPTNKLAIGNASYLNSSWQRGETVCEFLYSPNAESLSRLQTYYQTIRARGTGADRSVVPI